MKTPRHPRVSGLFARKAFTLVEMLVVITIIVILVIIAVPAFQAMLYSNNRIQAEEAFKGGLTLGRDSAIRGGQGQDALAVFLFEPGLGMRIVACQKVGVFSDTDRSSGAMGRTVQREVFVPIQSLQPVSMPRNWSVRGYAPAGWVDGGWYETQTGQVRYPQGQPAWVFPENAFFDANLATPATDGLNRQTFMVRFEGGSGRVSVSDPQAVLVVYPRESSRGRNSVNADLRLDLSKDLIRTVRRIMSDRLAATSDVARRALIGEISGDCILAKPVTQLSLYDEAKLAGALGVRIDAATGCIYAAGTTPRFVESDGQAITGRRIQQWIEGDTNFDGEYTAGLSQTTLPVDEPQARVFTLDRYLGTAQQVGLAVPQGVSP